MAELYEKGGRSADFALYIAKVRQDYGRRPLADEGAPREGARATSLAGPACEEHWLRRPHLCGDIANPGPPFLLAYFRRAYSRQRSPSAFAAVDTFMTRRRSRLRTGTKW
jgi:hypothetical protein